MNRKPDLEYRALCLISDLQELRLLTGWQGVADSLIADVARSVRVLSSAEAAEAIGAVVSDPLGVSGFSRTAASYFSGKPEVEASPRALEVLQTARVWAVYGFEGAARRLVEAAFRFPEGYKDLALGHLSDVAEAARRRGGAGPSELAVEVAARPPAKPLEPENASVEAPPALAQEVPVEPAAPAEETPAAAAAEASPPVEFPVRAGEPDAGVAVNADGESAIVMGAPVEAAASAEEAPAKGKRANGKPVGKRAPRKSKKASPASETSEPTSHT